MIPALGPRQPVAICPSELQHDQHRGQGKSEAAGLVNPEDPWRRKTLVHASKFMEIPDGHGLYLDCFFHLLRAGAFKLVVELVGYLKLVDGEMCRNATEVPYQLLFHLGKNK